MQQWHISVGGEEQGPFTAAQVAEKLSGGEFRAGEALARRESERDWRKLTVSGVLAEASMAGIKRPDGIPAPSVAPVPPTEPKEVVPQVGAAAGVDPYQPPTKLEIHPNLHAEVIAYPGIGRLAYFLLQMGISVVTYGLLFVGIAVTDGAGGMKGLVAVGMIAIIVGSIIGLYIGVKRVQNLGMSGWAILWSFVPIMSVWIGWRMYACPAGYDEHRELDLAGKILTWGMVGMIALGVVANVIAAASGG